MNDSQRGIAVPHFVGSNDARSDKIIDLIEIDFLSFKLFPN